jgi:hypothetical protein
MEVVKLAETVHHLGETLAGLVQYAGEKHVRLWHVGGERDGLQKLVHGFGKAAQAIGADAGGELDLRIACEDLAGIGDGLSGVDEVFVPQVHLD